MCMDGDIVPDPQHEELSVNARGAGHTRVLIGPQIGMGCDTPILKLIGFRHITHVGNTVR